MSGESLVCPKRLGNIKKQNLRSKYLFCHKLSLTLHIASVGLFIKPTDTKLLSHRVMKDRGCYLTTNSWSKCGSMKRKGAWLYMELRIWPGLAHYNQSADSSTLCCVSIHTNKQALIPLLLHYRRTCKPYKPTLTLHIPLLISQELCWQKNPR